MNLFNRYHLPENLELLFMLVLGILLQMTDGSPFSMKERWMIVWNTELPAEYFSFFVQKFIKTILSVIVVIRCGTTYAYVVSAMLVIFCILKKTTPKLMLLWLLIAGLKSVCLTFVEALSGVYVCSAFGKIRKACIEFFISKAFEIIFACYMWGSVLTLYQDMERKAEEKANLTTKDQFFTQKLDFGRQRTRSLLDESTLYKTACLNNFEFKDVPQIILQMLRRDEEMSQDSLLAPGMMLASVSNMGSFDNLKTSESLGELGFMDLGTTQVVGLEEDEELSHRDKALRFLKLSISDVKRIKLNKTVVGNDIYSIDEDTWKRVIASGTHINKPKQARTEIFIREIFQTEGEDGREKNRIKFDLKFGFSSSNSFNEKQTAELTDDQEEDESTIFSQEEEDEGEEEETTQLFMSNIADGTTHNKHGLGLAFTKVKGNAYAELLKQDYMMAIGAEVFDRATNLARVVLSGKITRELEPRTSASLPSFQEISQISNNKKMELQVDHKKKAGLSSSASLNFMSDSGEKINFQAAAYEDDENLIGSLTNFEPEHVENKKEDQVTLREDNKLKVIGTKEAISDVCKGEETQGLVSTNSTKVVEVEANPCYKKRIITIRRTGKQKIKQLFRKNSSVSSCSSEYSDGSHEIYSGSEKNLDKVVDSQYLERKSSCSVTGKSSESYNNSNNHSKTFLGPNKNQMYFLVELLQKPFMEVLIFYYDLRRRVYFGRNFNKWSQKQKFKFSNGNYHLKDFEKTLLYSEYNEKKEKIWKSKVLKMVESYNKRNSFLSIRKRLDSVKKRSSVRKLLKYEYFYLLNIKKKYLKMQNETKPLCFNTTESWRWSDSDISTRNMKTSDDSSDSKAESEMSLNVQNKMNLPGTLGVQYRERVKLTDDDFPLENLSVETQTEATSDENNKVKLAEVTDSNSSHVDVVKKHGEHEKLKPEIKNSREIKEQEKLETKRLEALPDDPEENSLCSQESDEPISLYYSKAANLASPLLDMKRFIYPDHIHYSYKHVKKKGFDVDINGGFPLLVRENLMSSPIKMGNEPTVENPECKITRRPMDLSFAMTNAFAEWQNNDQNDLESDVADSKPTQIINNPLYGKEEKKKSYKSDLAMKKKTKKPKSSRKNEGNENRSSLKADCSKQKSKSYDGNFSDFKCMYSAKDYILIEKLLKMHMRFNNNERNCVGNMSSERTPVQISSTQLHSNKGRKNSTYNPAIFLQENKTRNERKKIESQEERTKDMFARLESEALLQSKNIQKMFGPSWSS